MQVFVRSISAASAPAERDVDSPSPKSDAPAPEGFASGREAAVSATIASDLTGEAADDQDGEGAPAEKGATTAAALTGGDTSDATSATTLLQPHQRMPEAQSVAAAPTSPDRAPSAAHHAAEIVRHALPEVAEAARQTGRGTVEIALSPAELGHVRLTIHSDDGAMATVRLSADRHETLDLMRRHVELFAQDMRDLGYRELSFSFQDGPQRGPFDFIPPGEQVPSVAAQLRIPETLPDAPARLSRLTDGSLDLRL